MSSPSHQGPLSRRMVLAGLLTAAATPAWAFAPATSPRPEARGGVAQPTQPIQAQSPVSRAEDLIAAARLGGRVAYAVYDQRTGQLLEGRDINLGLPPASVAKAVTAALALERLGPEYRFTTRLVATGPIQNGVLQGDLILLGGGDPTLSTDDLLTLIQGAKAQGVARVAGRLLIHSGALPKIARIDGDQPDHVGYNPTISGLNLNFNRVHLEWKQTKGGWQVGMDARGKSVVPRVAMASARIVNRQSPTFTYESRGQQDHWTVASAALGKGGSRWLPVRQPEAYAGEVFHSLATAQGIALPLPATFGGQIQGTAIAQVSSPPLPEMLRDMLRHSTNITAEIMGLRSTGEGSLRGSAQQMNAWLAQNHGVEAGFVDHSGLGGRSRISPAAMAGLLLRKPQLAGLMRPFPTREKGQGPQVAAKTGTLNFVSGLAGFVQGPRPMVFAIFAADTPRRDALRDQEKERPAGGPEWTRRARKLQGQLIERWAASYGA